MPSRTRRFPASDRQARSFQTSYHRSLQALADCCKQLDYISVSGRHRSGSASSKISDAGLIALGQECPRLHGVSLNCELVTNAGIAALSGLGIFSLGSNDNFTMPALKALVRRSPELERLFVRTCGNFRQPLVHSLHEFRTSHMKLMRCLASDERSHNMMWEYHDSFARADQVNYSDDYDDEEDDADEEGDADEELVITFLEAAGAPPDVFAAFGRLLAP